VRKIAIDAFKAYKRLSLIDYVKNPRKTLKTALSYPKIIIKFIEDYLGRR